MFKKWQVSVGAILCAAGLNVEAVQGGPAGMTMSKRAPAAQTAASSSPIQPPAQAGLADESGSISPLRNPVKYLSNAVSESPIRTAFKSETPGRATAPPVRNDAVALGTPANTATPQLVIAMAQLSEQRGDVAQARQQYQRALHQWPGQTDLLRAAARMEDRQGQLALAESLYQQAVMGSQSDAGALNDLGLCLARQGKLEPSLQVLEQAVQLQPDKALYRNNVATVLVEMRQDQRALAHLAAVHSPAETQYNMGQLLVARNRSTEAEDYFESALDEDPNLEAARVALSQLPRRSTTPQIASQPTPSVAVAQQSVAATSPAVPPAGANLAPQSVAPQTPPQMVAPQSIGPQLGPQLGPYMGIPSEARNPGYGRSSYLPPAYVPPSGPNPGLGTPAPPQPNVPWVGQANPRYLPPVERR